MTSDFKRVSGFSIDKSWISYTKLNMKAYKVMLITFIADVLQEYLKHTRAYFEKYMKLCINIILKIKCFYLFLKNYCKTFN